MHLIKFCYFFIHVHIYSNIQGYTEIHYYNYIIPEVPNTEAALPCWSAILYK